MSADARIKLWTTLVESTQSNPDPMGRATGLSKDVSAETLPVRIRYSRTRRNCGPRVRRMCRRARSPKAEASSVMPSTVFPMS